MGKPVKLMQEDLLAKYHTLRENGSYIINLKKKLEKDLNITLAHQTLAKMIEGYDIYLKEENPALKQKYHTSLFPSWLTESKDLVVQQPCKVWGYRGKMPYGFWLRVDCEKCKGKGFYWVRKYEDIGGEQVLMSSQRIICCQATERLQKAEAEARAEAEAVAELSKPSDTEATVEETQ